MSLLENEWKKFKSFVIPDDASDEQIEDMRSAFLAGAMVTIDMIGKAVKDKDIDAINKVLNGTTEFIKSFFEDENQDTDMVFKDKKAEKVDLKNYVREIKHGDIKMSSKDFGLEIDLSQENIKPSEQPEVKLMLDKKGDIDVILCFENEKYYKAHTIQFQEWEFKKQDAKSTL